MADEHQGERGGDGGHAPLCERVTRAGRCTCGADPTPQAEFAGLDLAELRATNIERCARWHGPDTEPWTLADWSNAMCGEAGEAANVVKKIRRLDTGTDQHGYSEELRAARVDALADELADVVIYADLVAAHEGIDLSAAIVRKFNAVSVREGFPERLTSPGSTEGGERA